MTTTLEDLLGGRSARAFLTEDVGKRSFVVETDDPSRFTHLMSLEILSELLESHRLSWPRLRLAKDGTALPEDALFDPHTSRLGWDIPKLNAAKLSHGMGDGGTLVFDSIDQAHPPIRALAAHLEQEVGEKIQVNLYAALSGKRHGFDVHWDPHDVLILQVEGEKTWEVRGPSMLHPTHEDRERNVEPSEEVVWAGSLRAGEVLYIPRGWWHQAWPTGEPTMHLTVSFPHRTWLDVLDWLRAQASAVEFFRRDVVAGPSWAEFSGQLMSLLEQRDLSSFHLDHDAASAPRPNVQWTRGDLESGRLAWSGSRHSRLVLSEGEDAFSVGALGEVWEFDTSLHALFERLVSSPVTYRECLELAPKVPREDLYAFLQELVSLDLVVLLPSA